MYDQMKLFEQYQKQFIASVALQDRQKFVTVFIKKKKKLQWLRIY